MAYTKAKIKDLVEGMIDCETLYTMLLTPKDKEGFKIYLAILQEQVQWDNKIILPLGLKV